ncbi:MAG: hypothetical protein ACOYOP_06900 [Microthrixaceae bacterium]
MTAVRERLARRRMGSGFDPADRPFILGGVVVVGVLLGLVAVMLDRSALDVWTGLIVLLVLVTVSVPLLQWVARKEGDQWLFTVLVLAVVVHLLFALIRYYFIFAVYKGSADAGRYHEAGTTFASRFRDGEPIHPIPIMEGFPVESQRIGDVTGVLYLITGPSAYAGFFLFSWLCFWGQVLIVRGFKRAVPEGDYRRYTLLVMFLPSLLFWPASIGKEALMIFCLGIIVYGGAMLLGPTPQLKGGLYFVGGVILVLLVRPHVALMSLGGLAVAMGVGTLASSNMTERLGARGRAVRLVALVALLALAGVAVSVAGQSFADRGADGASAGSALEKALNQSATGNSEFQPVAVTGPAQVPAGVVSVLFRPFPWEARNPNSLLAAAESLLLLGLVAASWRRLATFPKMAVRRPFLVFCLVYVLAFAIGFSFIANFGILARQRVQVLPIVLVFLALPRLDQLRARDRSAAAAGSVEPAGSTVASAPKVMS